VGLDSRTLAWATLAHKTLPQRAVVALLREFGGPEAALAASRRQLASVVPAGVVDRTLAPVERESFQHTCAWLDHADHHLIAWDDGDYPPALLELGHAPPVLFHMGRRELLAQAAFAVVGSRHATPQGRDTAREFAHALGSAALTIVSGLAVGIDAAAHEGALGTTGSTIAVVGTGLDRVYPARNRDLAARVAQDGALLSEYVPGTPARKEHFPQRNRLISGLARGVLVVEATLSSGSLITARLAGEQGRDVFAVPGSIHSPFAKGCHKLIREGAKLVETASDILDELYPKQRQTRVAAPVERGHMHTDVHPMLAAMGYDPVSIDALVARMNVAPDAIAAELVTLEYAGEVAALPGGYWQRLHTGGSPR
jgi:DNA processing protein